MESFAARRKELTHTEANLMKRILDRIERGRPADGTRHRKRSCYQEHGLVGLATVKQALERLHLAGNLLTTRRRDFQKYTICPTT